MSNSKALKIRRCIVCSNTNRTATDVSYFRIPLDQDYAEKWFINLRRTDLLDELFLHTSSFICSDHFPPDRMFLCKANDQYLKRLKRGALPYKITEDGQVEDPTSEKSDDDNDESFDCSIADMIRQKMHSADDTGGLDTTTNGYADNETSTNDVDEDFNLDLFDDVDPKEIEQYKTHFPKLEKIADSKTHCTSCQYHIGTAPINEAFIKMHPILRVTQCKKCFTFYNSGEFERGEDGSELYCRWCGQGGEVYCCSNCPYVFCRRCIVQNLSRNMVTEIQNNENWSCFACAPQCMIPLRASHWALVNFIEKQKREITNRSVDEIEMNDLMSNDISRCCSSSKKRCSLKRKVENTAVITPPPEKRKSYAPSPKLVNATRKSVENKTAAEDDDSVAVQCTPDILSLFNNEEQTSSPNTQAAEAPPLRLIRREVTIRPNNSGATRPSLPTPPQPTPPPPQATPPPQQPVVAPSPPIQTASPLPVQMTPTTSNPVYHTINGFRIDLNTAAQQETYRLPNGKLIQVKKQTPNTTQAGPTPPERTPPVVSRPPPVVARPSPVVTRPPILPPRTSLPSIRSYVSVRNPVGPSPPVRPARQSQFQIQHRQPIQIQTRLVGHNQIRLMNGPIIQQLPTPPPTTQQTNNPNHPPPLVFRTGHGNSPVGKARTQFEERVDNSMEVCQHIIGKINTLTSSSSYKKVRSLMDLKDLTIHLSYLLTYAIGRFKTLQEKCIEDMKAMGFDPDKAADPASDDDDIVIVEPKTTTINLDSDEEEDVPTAPTNITEHTNNIEQMKSVSNGDHNIENGAPSQPQQNHLGNELTTNDITNNNKEVEKQQNTDNTENVSGELLDKQVPMDVSDSTGTFTENPVNYDDDVVQVVEEINENDATENLSQTEDYDKLPEVAKDKPFEINEKEPAEENESEKIPEPTTQELVEDNVEAVEKVKENNVQTEPEKMEISFEVDKNGATDKSVEDNMSEDNSEMIETRKETVKDKVSEEREETAVEITSEKLADEADEHMQEEVVEPGDQTTPQIPATTEVEGIPEETSENVSGPESKASEENSEIVTPIEENATEIVPEAEASDNSEKDSLGNNLDVPTSNVSSENRNILFPEEKLIDASPSSIKENIVEEYLSEKINNIEVTTPLSEEKLIDTNLSSIKENIIEDLHLPEEINNIDAKTPLSDEKPIDAHLSSIKENIVEDNLSEEINNIEAKPPLSEERLIDAHLSSIKENIVEDNLSEEINNIEAKSSLSEEKLIDSHLSSIKENIVEDDIPEEIININAKTPLSEGNEVSVMRELPEENVVGPVPEVTDEKSGDAILDKSTEAIVEQNSTIADEITEFFDNNSDDTVLASTEIPDVPEEENITNPISDILCHKITDNICIPDDMDDSMCESTTAGDNLSLLDDIGDSLCASTTAGNEDMDCNDKLTENICLSDDIADRMLESTAPGEDRDSSTLLDDIVMKTLELDTSV